MASSTRSNEVDIIRMAALIGICMVNVPFMALPVESVFIAPASQPDRWAAFFVECFFQLKFFILFSFIFGWGMAVQAQSAEAKGQPFARRYFRRMVGLAILGAGHAILVFSGDILLLYALLGSLLWLIRKYPARKLMKVTVWMLPLSMLCLATLAVLIDALTNDPSVSLATAGGASLGGNFLEATEARLMDWPATFALLLLLQGPLAFGAFAAGLAAAKSDFFAETSHGFDLLRRRWPLLLIVALPLNILYAAVVGGIIPQANDILSFFGFVLVAVGAPALSLVYLYFFIRLARGVRVPDLLVRAGQNSLSSYVMQGVLAGLMFGSYGLGLFDAFGHAGLLPVSLGIALAAMLLVGLYARAFGRGPLEPVLRKISGT